MSSAPRPLARAPSREPYRMLFPLGAGLGVVAVLPFAAGGAGGGALALFHSVAQIQGFLTCFAVGFLFTFLPPGTGTAPPRQWELLLAHALPVAAVGCAWVDEPVLATAMWLVVLAMALHFTLVRLGGGAGARLPPAALWVPLALAAAIAGAVLVAFGPRLLPDHAIPAWTIGRGLLVQGFVAGLVLGVSGLLVPALTRGEPPPVAAGPGARRRGLVLHGAAALAFFGTFPLEVLAPLPRLGFALRAAIAAAVLVGAARIHRLPTLPGLERRLVWLATWLVPLGFALGALGPRARGAALHVLFVGGFAQLTFALSTHVILSRARRPALPPRRSRALSLMAALLAAAFGARIAAALDLRHVAAWLGVAAVAFAGAAAAWGAVVAPALRGRVSPRVPHSPT